MAYGTHSWKVRTLKAIGAAYKARESLGIIDIHGLAQHIADQVPAGQPRLFDEAFLEEDPTGQETASRIYEAFGDSIGPIRTWVAGLAAQQVHNMSLPGGDHTCDTEALVDAAAAALDDSVLSAASAVDRSWLARMFRDGSTASSRHGSFAGSSVLGSLYDGSDYGSDRDDEGRPYVPPLAPPAPPAPPAPSAPSATLAITWDNLVQAAYEQGTSWDQLVGMLFDHSLTCHIKDVGEGLQPTSQEICKALKASIPAGQFNKADLEKWLDKICPPPRAGDVEASGVVPDAAAAETKAAHAAPASSQARVLRGFDGSSRRPQPSCPLPAAPVGETSADRRTRIVDQLGASAGFDDVESLGLTHPVYQYLQRNTDARFDSLMNLMSLTLSAEQYDETALKEKVDDTLRQLEDSLEKNGAMNLILTLAQSPTELAKLCKILKAHSALEPEQSDYHYAFAMRGFGPAFLRYASTYFQDRRAQVGYVLLSLVFGAGFGAVSFVAVPKIAPNVDRLASFSPVDFMVFMFMGAMAASTGLAVEIAANKRRALGNMLAAVKTKMTQGASVSGCPAKTLDCLNAVWRATAFTLSHPLTHTVATTWMVFNCWNPEEGFHHETPHGFSKLEGAATYWATGALSMLTNLLCVQEVKSQHRAKPVSDWAVVSMAKHYAGGVRQGATSVWQTLTGCCRRRKPASPSPDGYTAMNG